MPLNTCRRCKKEAASLRPCKMCEQDYCPDCYHIHAPNCDPDKAIDDVDVNTACSDHPTATVVCQHCRRPFCQVCYANHQCNG